MDGVAPAAPLGARVRSLLARGWILLALALAVRVIQIAATRDWNAVADPEDYIRHAVSIAGGNGMADSLIPHGGPSAIRPPAYPYLLGGVFALTGDSETAGRIASALLGVVTVALIGLIADLLWSRRAAFAAMAIAAVYPPLVLLSGTLLSEALGLPLMLAMLVLVVAYRDEPRPAWVAPVAGLLFALALLDRPAFAVAGLALVAGLWGRPARSARALRAPLIALAVAGLAIVPWTIRNAIEFDDFVPISTQSGFLLAGTYNEVSDKDPRLPGAYRPASFVPALRPIVTDPSLDENQMNKELAEAGREYAKDHPGYIPRVLWWNGLRVLSLSDGIEGGKTAYAYQGIGPRYAVAATIAWYVLALLAIAGAALGAARHAPWWLWALIPLFWLSAIWISGDVRYRLPIDALVVLLAAYAVTSLTDRRRAPRPRPT